MPNFNQPFTTWTAMWTRVVVNRFIYLSAFSRVHICPYLFSRSNTASELFRRPFDVAGLVNVDIFWLFDQHQSKSPSITPRCKLKWYTKEDRDKGLFVLSVGPNIPSGSVTREYWWSSDSLFQRRAHTHPRVLHPSNLPLLRLSYCKFRHSSWSTI